MVKVTGEGAPKQRGLVEHNFDLSGNGRIEGHVKDDSRKPATSG